MKSWSFGQNNDELIGLVLSGKKTATSSLYNSENLPQIGEETVICFDNEKEACIVRTVDYKIIKFDEMTTEYAKLEGENDLSLDNWRTTHYNFFKSLDASFNEESLIVFETFEVIENLVEKRLELGQKIAYQNIDIFKNINSLSEIDSGFRNTLFSVNDKYVIKVCTNCDLEDTFKIEYNFYHENALSPYIPKLYKFDNTKKDVNYIYEILEKVSGNTLYYHWYKMKEAERENTIQKLIGIIETFHSVKCDEYNWTSKIKREVKDRIVECEKLFENSDYNIILKSIETYDEYLSDNRFALIHNDLHFDNIIYDGNALKIIDFNDSMVAPIDFEFRLLYMCQEQPWKWANAEMDPYQKLEDYKNIWTYIKKYYKQLNEVKYLEQRMIIYKIWDDAKHLKKLPDQELIKVIVENSKKLIAMV